MNTATCNWSTMRVIDYTWLLLLLLFCLTNQLHALSCNEITPEDGSSFEKFKTCELKDTPSWGDLLLFVRLDFSAAQGDQITEFFGKAKTDATLLAAFRLVGNKEITKIDFGKVKTWTAKEPPKGEAIIEIVNNPTLNEIKIDALDSFGLVGNAKVLVLVYNNPLLVWKKETADKIRAGTSDNSYFVDEPFACTFQNPLDKKKSIVPTPALMEKCQIFKGDLNMEGGTMKGSVTFKEGCLRLVNVDMKEVTNITVEHGKDSCELDGVSPEIKNNKNLCGDKMATVAAYAGSATIQLHETCTDSCTDQATVDHKFYRCNDIKADGISLNKWFTPGYENVAEKLKEAKGISIKGSPDITTISMPALKKADNLEITDNPNLQFLDLSSLENADVLTIKNNKKLTLAEIRKLPRNLTVVQSTVECNTDQYTVVSDIEELRLCTKIIGQLVIKHATKDAKPGRFNITEIEGCVTIENTDLTNLKFLEKANISCTGKHTLNNNRNLCRPKFLGSKNTGDGATVECGKTCTSQLSKSCVTFTGDLTVDSKTPSANLTSLETINGKLTITDAGPSLEFPALKTIISREAPALIISQNPQLTSLKMPKIDKIDSETGGQPKVKIEDSPKLTNFNQFLPKDWESCSQSASAPCQIDKSEEEEESSNMGLIIGIVAGVVLVILLGIGIWLWCKYKKKKTKKTKTKSKDKTKAKSITKTAPIAEVKPPEVEESGSTKTDTPSWETLDAIQQRFPITTNILYLNSIAGIISFFPQEPIQFRILLRGKISQKDVEEGHIVIGDLEWYDFVRDKKNRIESNRIGLNRPVFLVSESCQQYSELFFNAVSESAELQKADNEKQKKKKDRTKAGKSKEVSEETKNEGSKELPKEEKGKSKELSKETSKEVANERTGKSKEVTKETSKELVKDKSKELPEKGGEKRKELSKEKSKELPVKEKKKKRKPSKESTNKTQKTKLIHIGPGFAESMKHNKNFKITPVTDANGEPYTKNSEHFENLKCSLILMEYTDRNGVQKLEVELMEMIVPDVVIGQLRNLIKCPWIKLLYYAWQNNIVIHTSVPDYLVLSCYIYTTIDVLNYRIRDSMTEYERESFALATIYPIYHKIFSGKDLDEFKMTENDFDEITAFTIYITCMVEWMREYAKRTDVGNQLKDIMQHLVTADEFIYTRWKENKTDKVQWHLHVKHVDNGDDDPDRLEKKEKYREKYYQLYHDTTPFHLSAPVNLEYSKPVKYDEDLDNLMRKPLWNNSESEPVNTPEGGEKRKKRTSRKCEDVEKVEKKKEEEKKTEEEKKKEEKKTEEKKKEEKKKEDKKTEEEK